MKRDVFLVFIIFSFLLILFSQFVYAEYRIDPITGKLTSQQVGMSIFIQTIIPYIQIISPKNETYLTNESILLDYILTNGDYVWYNLDNSANITINSSIYMDVSQGAHTLYIFSNNSNTTTTSSVGFTANSSKFIVFYENYKGGTKGSSTDFSNYAYDELQSLNNVILENTNYGKIKFNETINVTDNSSGGNSLNIDSNILISSNRIELESSEIPNFNKSATLWLYNLTFTNPRILKDGIICPSTTCTKESYIGNTLKFNVTGFSVYSSEETPVEVPPVEEKIVNGGSHGGGGGVVQSRKFEIIPKEIQISIKQGETTSRTIIITNSEDKRMKINLSDTFVKEFIRLNETEFYIEPKESKEIRIDFIVSKETSPDIYIGKVIATVGQTQKDVLIAIEVESKSPLFDVKLKIPTKFQYVLPSEEILAQIEIYNLGSLGKTDVLLDYVIKDSEGNEVLKEQDTIAVETSTSFIKSIQIPNNLPFGRYVFYVKTTYNGKVASASALFNVGKKEINKLMIFLYVLVSIIIIILLITILEIRKIKKYIKPIYNVDESSLLKNGFILDDDDE
jgi:hypothetical protein